MLLTNADVAEAPGGLNADLLTQQGIEPNPGPMPLEQAFLDPQLEQWRQQAWQMVQRAGVCPIRGNGFEGMVNAQALPVHWGAISLSECVAALTCTCPECVQLDIHRPEPIALHNVARQAYLREGEHAFTRRGYKAAHRVPAEPAAPVDLYGALHAFKHGLSGTLRYTEGAEMRQHQEEIMALIPALAHLAGQQATMGYLQAAWDRHVAPLGGLNDEAKLMLQHQLYMVVQPAAQPVLGAGTIATRLCAEMLSAARVQYKGSLCFLEALTAYHQGRAIFNTLPANAPAALAPTLSHFFYLRLRPSQAVPAAWTIPTQSRSPA